MLQVSSSLFFKYNTALGTPYRVLVDTNFISFSIQNKLDLVKGMMDCLYAKCILSITDCVMAELEKLGQKYRIALRIAKESLFERILCTHEGTYAISGRKSCPVRYLRSITAHAHIKGPEVHSKLLRID